MTDPTGKAAETGAFGTGDGKSVSGAAEAPRDTSQDERPSKPSAADEHGGTTEKPAQLDRPLPSDDPLKVRFAKEE
jgi:hypothetical protein